MSKLDVLKKLASAGAKAAGFAGSNDKVKAVEAQKEVLELKLALARQALEDIHALVDVQVVPRVQTFDAILNEARQALELLGKVE